MNIETRRQANRLGHAAEWRAVWRLRLAGYSILARRYKTKLGEIDIVARRGGVLAFVEVKARADLDDRGPTRCAAGSSAAWPRAASLFVARHPHYAAHSRALRRRAGRSGCGRVICRTSGARRSSPCRSVPQRRTRISPGLRELCAGDGERVDLLEAALILQHPAARRGDRSRAVASARRGDGARPCRPGAPARRVSPSALADVIASAYGYRGDSETYDDLQNADLAQVIERRKGLPVALSILYLHVARAQGWEAEGLAFPGHFLIRIGIDGVAPRPRSLPQRPRAATPPSCAACCSGCWARQPSSAPSISIAVPDRDVLLRLENNVRLRLAKREDWAGTSRSLDRMLAIAPDRPELLFEAGQINARLDKRRAAIAAFERFLGLDEADWPIGELRQRAADPVAGTAARA